MESDVCVVLCVCFGMFGLVATRAREREKEKTVYQIKMLTHCLATQTKWKLELLRKKTTFHSFSIFNHSNATHSTRSFVEQRCAAVAVAVAFVKGACAPSQFYLLFFRVNLQKFIYTLFSLPTFMFVSALWMILERMHETNSLLSCLSCVSLCSTVKWREKRTKLIRWGSKETKTYYKVSYFFPSGLCCFCYFHFFFHSFFW